MGPLGGTDPRFCSQTPAYTAIARYRPSASYGVAVYAQFLPICSLMDFTSNQLFMKLFRTGSIDVVQECLSILELNVGL